MSVLAVPVSAAAVAYACTALATIASNPTSATPGTAVLISGQGFAPHDPSDARTEPVRLRFDSPSGPVIGTASPSSSAAGGKFTVSITIPEMGPGAHVLLATQNGTDGRPAFGTPARQGFEVLPTPAAATDVPGAVADGPATFGLPSGPLTSVATTPAVSTSGLRRAVSSCRRRFSPASARTRRGKSRMTRRRSACIRRANARFS